MATKTTMTPFEQHRRTWCEQGFPVLANAHTATELLAWAKRTGRFRWIDRKTRWGNPYELPRNATDAQREAVVQDYARWFDTQYALHGTLHELEAQVLACWYTPKMCHGEILLARSCPQFAAEYLATCATLRQPSPPLAGSGGQQRGFWER